MFQTHGYLLVLPLLATSVVLAQSGNDFSNLSKEELIARAVALVDEPTFKPEKFDQISVWNINGKVCVIFNQSIRFIPSQGSHCYEANVNLTDSSWTAQVMGKGDKKTESKFYYPKKADQKKIDLVMKVILDTVGNQAYVDKVRQEGYINIHEKDDYFSVTIHENQAAYYTFKLNKKTKEIYDDREARMRLDDRNIRKHRIY